MVVNDTIICMWIRGRGEAFRWKPNQLVMRLTTRLLSTVQEKVMKCNGCKGTIQYWSKSCQRADWPRHKVMCKQQKNSKK